MKKFDIVELMTKTKAVPEGTDINRYLTDNIENCFTATEASFDSLDKALTALDEYDVLTKNISNDIFIVTYVIEIYEADEDGEFIEGSDYHWTKTYVLREGKVVEA